MTGSVHFVRGSHGKPSIAGRPQCRFSLSYCGDLAVIALTRDIEIGVDFERVRPIQAVEDLAAYHFSDQEFLELLTLQPGAARDRAFLRGWVRKEACVKAVGLGLTLPTNAFVSGIGPHLRTVVMTVADREMMLAVGTISPAPRGHVAAWAAVVPAHRHAPN